MLLYQQETHNNDCTTLSARGEKMSMTTERDEADEVRTFINSMKSKRIGHARKGEQLFSKGKRIAEIFLIRRGEIKIDMASAQGRTTVGLVGADSWLSEGALDDADVHSTTATAVAESDYIAFPRASFPKLLDEHALFHRFFTRGATKTARALNAAMSSHILHSAHMRMAEYFLGRFPRADQRELLIPATPKHYGELNNMVRQTAHRVINDFEAAGLLTRREGGRSYLLNRAALEEYLQWEKSPVANTAHEFAHFLIGRKKK